MCVHPPAPTAAAPPAARQSRRPGRQSPRPPAAQGAGVTPPGPRRSARSGAQKPVWGLSKAHSHCVEKGVCNTSCMRRRGQRAAVHKHPRDLKRIDWCKGSRVLAQGLRGPGTHARWHMWHMCKARHSAKIQRRRTSLCACTWGALSSSRSPAASGPAAGACAGCTFVWAVCAFVGDISACAFVGAASVRVRLLAA